jgi:hypothetical protein
VAYLFTSEYDQGVSIVRKCRPQTSLMLSLTSPGD